MIKRVTVGDVELQVRDEGQGRELLFVHGFPLDHSMWRCQIDELSDSYRVLAIDLRGFGGSGPAGQVLGMDMLADDCAGVLEALDIQRPVVFCGLSMGGYVAWQFWARHSRRLAGLILCDTRAAADSSDTARTRRESAIRVVDEGPEFLIESMTPRMLSRNTLQERPELVAEVRQMMKRVHKLTMAAALCGMATRGDMTMRLSDIAVPTLVVCGVEDAISPMDEMRSLAAKMPRATFVDVPDAGHLAPLEQPERVNDAIRDFMDTLAQEWRAMDAQLQLALGQIKSAREYLNSMIADLAEDDWFRMPDGWPSHAAWQIGHLAMAQYGLCLYRQRGRSESDGLLMPGSFRKQFTKGSRPEPDPAKNPPPAEIRGTFARVFEQVLVEVPTLSAEQLAEPVDMPYAGTPTKLGALVFSAHHEMLHAGQLGVLRRLLGKDPIR